MQKTNRSAGKLIMRLTRMAVMAAVYYVLTTFLTFRLGNLRITLASVAVVLMASVYGPLEGSVVAFLGEFLAQVTGYGITLTTPLWCLVPVIRALVVAGGCAVIRRMGRMSKRAVMGGVMTTVTIAMIVLMAMLAEWGETKVFGGADALYVRGLVSGVTLSHVMAAAVSLGLTIAVGYVLGSRLEKLDARVLLFGTLLIVAAIMTTVINTLVIWLDSVIYGYYTQAYVFGQFAVRIVTGAVTAVLVCALCVPLTAALRRVDRDAARRALF